MDGVQAVPTIGANRGIAGPNLVRHPLTGEGVLRGRLYMGIPCGSAPTEPRRPRTPRRLVAVFRRDCDDFLRLPELVLEHADVLVDFTDFDDERYTFDSVV